MLDKAVSAARAASRFVVWIGGAMLLFAAFMTTVEVFARKFFSFSFAGADEIAGYLFAISTAFAFAFCMLERAHVRIDALYMVLPRGVRRLLDLLGFLLLGGFLALLTVRGFTVWHGSWENDSVSITPLVTPLDIPQGFWLAGLIFFMVVFVIVLLRLIQAIVQRDWRTYSRLIGARTLDEEVQAETDQAAAGLAHEHASQNRKDS
ncbi:MAG: TRAP transporter small permease [Pseudomonadota bacterium]